MATQIFFISESYFKEHTPVNLNVEPQLVTMGISDAQFLHIQQILGSKLYKSIEAKVADGTISSDPTNINYKVLLDDYINPSLVQWALYECIPYLKFKMMNKGVVNQNSDNSAQIDLEEMKFLQESIRNKAEFYTQRLSDHIIGNMSFFTEYTSANRIDDLLPERTAYFCGLNLDGDDKFAIERFLGLNSHVINANI